jgi:N-acetylmuramoyl-L-alanine amidase
MRPINRIIIHATATPEGRHHTAADIDRWHKQRGWSGIGYHYVIRLDGTTETGRPLERVGAHVAGHNSDSIGIAYVGGCDAAMKPKDTRTDAQKAALITLLKDLRRRWPKAVIIGHRELDRNKACPCFDARREYEKI